jgi:hypothetical protein
MHAGKIKREKIRQILKKSAAKPSFVNEKDLGKK